MTDVSAALLAGLVGAVTIFLYLTISLPLFFHTPPILLYTWDASNALGYGQASQASIPTILLIGQGMHVIVSLIWGFVFVLCASVLPQLRTRPVPWGFVFGLVVMLVMRFGVVPLGHAPHVGMSLVGAINNIVAHTVFFGVPVALVAAKRMHV